MTEAEYDELIAPALADIAMKVAKLGGSFIARVEWQKDEAGITAYGVTRDSGVGQRLTEIAALTRGNVDALCIEAMKQFDCSQSLILGPYGRQN